MSTNLLEENKSNKKDYKENTLEQMINAPKEDNTTNNQNGGGLFGNININNYNSNNSNSLFGNINKDENLFGNNDDNNNNFNNSLLGKSNNNNKENSLFKRTKINYNQTKELI